MMPSVNLSDDISFLAREAAATMVARLDLIALQPKKVVLYGCEVEQLRKRYPEADYKIDLEETEILALPDHSVDMIFANLFLPWCQDLKKVVAEWSRILRPEGFVMFSSFGPDTLMELREHFAEHLLTNLIDMHNVGDELMNAHIHDPVLDVEYVTVTYRDVMTLLSELQAMKMFSSRLSALELKPNTEGVFPITYEIIYGHGFRAAITAGNFADEWGVVKIPLSQLRSAPPTFTK